MCIPWEIKHRDPKDMAHSTFLDFTCSLKLKMTIFMKLNAAYEM
jgi:hypothetical protein